MIGESFGDIFFANCFQNGVLALRLRADEIARTAARAAEGAPMTVDLGSQRITLPGGEQIAFEVDPMRRDALLGGLDGIGRTLKRADLITAWQQHDRQVRPWVWTPTGG